MVHLAGHVVKVGTHVMQRCMACGYKLIDVDLSMVSVCSTSGDNSIGNWQVGALVEVEGSNPVQSSLVTLADSSFFDEPWKGCCVE